MTTITYKDEPMVIDGDNWFRLAVGVDPSFGQLTCTKEVADTLWSSRTAAGTLVIEGAETVTLPDIWLVKVVPIDRRLCTIVVADSRIEWKNKSTTLSYNTYAQSRSGGGTTPKLANMQSATVPHPWSTVVGHVVTALGITTPANPGYPTRPPRHILGRYRSAAAFLKEVLYQLHWFVSWDPTTGLYKFHKLGTPQGTDAADIAAIREEYSLRSTETIKINTTIINGTELTAAVGIDAATDTEGSFLNIGSVPFSGNSGTTPIPTIYSDATGDEPYITEWLTEEAASYTTDHWFDDELADIRNVKLSSAVHEVTWRVTSNGVVTRIRAYRPLELPEIVDDTPFYYGKFPLPTPNVMAWISGAVSGQAGMYTARMFGGSVNTNPSGALQLNHLGSLGGIDDAYVWHIAEILTANYPIVELRTGVTVVGQIIGTHDDGKKIIVVDQRIPRHSAPEHGMVLQYTSATGIAVWDFIRSSL